MSRHTLVHAVRALASVCDGAAALDGQGYNGTDAKFGNRLAELPEERWTDGMRRAAWEMLRKYQQQLANHGVAYVAIPEPPPVDDVEQAEARQDARRALYAYQRQVEAPSGNGDRDGSAATSERVVSVEDGPTGPRFVVRFPYDVKMVAEIRGVPGRRWDGHRKVNTVPASPYAVPALVQFAERNRFHITEDARARIEALVAAGGTEEAPPPPPESMASGVHWNDGRFLVAFEYDPDMVAEVKEIDGRTWDGERRVWIVPAVMDAGEQLQAFAERHDLPIDAEASGHLQRVAVEMKARLEASHAAEADLDLSGLAIPEDLAPYPFQVAGVQYALRTRRCWIADEMGLGKTIQAILTLLKADTFPAIIVCPASLKLNWRRECVKWMPRKKVLVVESRTTRGQIEWADVLIVNYDIIKVSHTDPHNNRSPYQADRLLADLIDRRNVALILDESHYAKNSRARRTKACKLLAKGVHVSSQKATGLPYRLLLTGTPLMNRPSELVSQLQILDRLNDLGGYTHFTRTYCNATQTRYGQDTSGHANLEDLNQRLRATCYIRRLKRDVMKELPPKQRAIVPVELDNRAEYRRAEEDLIAWLMDTAKDEAEASAKVLAAMRAEQLVRLNALKQLAGKGKLAAAQQWVQDFLESGEKLIFFGHHRHIVHAIAEMFDAPKITGDTPLDRRQEAVDRFQNDDATHIIACNIQAGGVGLTLTAASNVAFLELGWTPAAHDQAEDRCHRIGQEADSVNAWYLLAEDTIDEEIYALIQEKRRVVTAAADGEAAEIESSLAAELVSRLREKKRA